jgi:hypothetical protein
MMIKVSQDDSNGLCRKFYQEIAFLHGKDKEMETLPHLSSIGQFPFLEMEFGSSNSTKNNEGVLHSHTGKYI